MGHAVWPGAVNSSGHSSRLLRFGIHGALVVVALASWTWSLQVVELDRLGGLGLAAILPWQYYLALAAVILSFGILIYRKRNSFSLSVLHLVVLAVVWHATPAVLYGAPRYPYSYKHIGVIARIQSGAPIDPGIDAYFNWPGYFSLNALLNSVTGLTDSLGLAMWAPLFYNLAYLGVLMFIYRGLGSRSRHMLLAAWFFMLTSWVGQDYFAPQALGYFWHLGILGILITWFGRHAGRGGTLYGLDADATPVQRGGLALFVVLTFAALVASHQLTPIVTLASVGTLVIFRRINGYLLALLLLGIQLVWFAYPAATYLSGNLPNIVSAVGALVANLTASAAVLPDAASMFAPERTLIVAIRRWMSVAVWALALGGVVRNWLQGSRNLTAILLAAVPFAFIALGSYGGEMLLRIYFFSLPFVAWFIGALLLPKPAAKGSIGYPLLVIAISAALAVGNAFAYFGNEAINYISTDELAALEAVYGTAPSGSLIVTATETAPVNFDRYGEISYRSIESMEGLDPNASPNEQVRQLAAILRADGHTANYVVITRSQEAYAQAFARLPDGVMSNLEEALTLSPWFRPLYQSLDAKAFVLVPGVTEP